jgi:CheY-like chemotaxis protein
MAAFAAGRNLLFGLLALQNGLINQGQLVAAFQAWTLDKSRNLADHLEARGDLTAATRALLESLAYDGLSGLDTARAYRPHCMILDINMPIMNGYALAEAIRKDDNLQHAKLIALTACTYEEARRRAHEAGFDHHLAKPADLVELQSLLETVETRLPSDG